MASKHQLVTELYQRTSMKVTKSPRAWQEFLSSACRNYKCRFDEQLLIYAQRPDAVAVATIETWNKRFGRWVNKGRALPCLTRKAAGTPSNIILTYRTPTRATMAACPCQYGGWMDSMNSQPLNGYPTGLEPRKAEDSQKRWQKQRGSPLRIICRTTWRS